MAEDTLDAELIGRTLRGETQAFGELVHRHAPAVIRFVGGLAWLSAEEREEIAQESFVRAYEKLEQFDPRRSFPAWVAGFARNVLSEVLARLKRQEEAKRRWIGAAAAEAGLRHAREAGAGRAEHRMDALHACVESLPEPMRTVLRQHYADGLPLAAISASAARPLGTIKSLLHRARLEVRDCVSRKLMNA